jgi:hypothetical protein
VPIFSRIKHATSVRLDPSSVTLHRLVPVGQQQEVGRLQRHQGTVETRGNCRLSFPRNFIARLKVFEFHLKSWKRSALELEIRNIYCNNYGKPGNVKSGRYI